MNDFTNQETRSKIYSHEKLLEAINEESEGFQRCLLWLEEAMPSYFFEDMPLDEVLLVAHNLMGFDQQDYFSTINLPTGAIVLCLDSDEAGVQILRNYRDYGIKNYRAYRSLQPPPFPHIQQNLRVATIYFTEVTESQVVPFEDAAKQELWQRIQQRNTGMSNEEFNRLIGSMNTRFLTSLRPERLVVALEMYSRAKTRDHCQYEVVYNENWESQDLPSMQIVFAWKNTPKHAFLYEVAQCVSRHGLIMKTVNGTYIDPYSRGSILLMALGLHGANGKAAWEVADIPDFLRELVTLKYFDDQDRIDPAFVQPRLLTGNQANVIRAMTTFVHQALVHVDPYVYSYENIEEAICRHPELTVKMSQAFTLKFDPDLADVEAYQVARESLVRQIELLDTGQEEFDTLRKNVLFQGVNFIDHILKTNAFRNNKTALSFRMDPKYLDHIPFDRKEKFPVLPYGIFFARGMRFFGFQIRFKDLARGGLRTVFPDETERAKAERAHVFTECYNLSYTQQKKNKDIPEGGSKAVIFLWPYDRLDSEATIYRKEMQVDGIEQEKIEEKMAVFLQEQKIEYLYQAQRSFIESLIAIVNCEPDGTIRAKNIVDYWRRPEYIYLGPDENMHNPMVQWIAAFAKKYHYKPGGAFISSKPNLGINHKEYGVTSYGVHVCAGAMLKYLGIDPSKEAFTVKMTGGPDGDVAGNEIANLYRTWPKTAKLVALTDGSGTIADSEGLQLDKLVHLFEMELPISHYNPSLLSPGGFLLDKNRKREESPLVTHTLCWRNKDGEIVEDWISGSEMNYLYRNNVHNTKTDLFIPAGGRPRTINEGNVQDFLTQEGEPTARGIVEGANLYFSPAARQILQEKGALIIKDSSANKGGVICSSFEVLCGLTLDDETFIANKDRIAEEILHRIAGCAEAEAELMLQTHAKTGRFLTEISDQVSESINRYTYELLDYLETVPLSTEPGNPLTMCFLSYALPVLRELATESLLHEVPEHHKKAIIACHIAARMVYTKGLDWSPSIVDILPIIMEDPELTKAPSSEL